MLLAQSPPQYCQSAVLALISDRSPHSSLGERVLPSKHENLALSHAYHHCHCDSYCTVNHRYIGPWLFLSTPHSSVIHVSLATVDCFAITAMETRGMLLLAMLVVMASLNNSGTTSTLWRFFTLRIVTILAWPVQLRPQTMLCTAFTTSWVSVRFHT